MTGIPVCATIALAADARLVTQPLLVRGTQLQHLYDTLTVLADRGHVAAFRIGSVQPAVTPDRLLQTLGHILGRAEVDSAGRAKPSYYLPPAHILPVGAFRPDRDGVPVSHGRLLGPGFALFAIPSSDGEKGLVLPGMSGRWFIAARTAGG